MPEPLYTGSPVTHTSWDGLTSWVDVGNGQAQRLDHLGNRTDTFVNVNDLRPWEGAERPKEETQEKSAPPPSASPGGRGGGAAPAGRRGVGAAPAGSTYVAPVSSPNSVPTTGAQADPNRGLTPGQWPTLAQRQQQQAALAGRATRAAGANPSMGGYTTVAGAWTGPSGVTYVTTRTPDGAIVVRRAGADAAARPTPDPGDTTAVQPAAGPTFNAGNIALGASAAAPRRPFEAAPIPEAYAGADAATVTLASMLSQDPEIRAWQAENARLYRIAHANDPSPFQGVIDGLTDWWNTPSTDPGAIATIEALRAGNPAADAARADVAAKADAYIKSMPNLGQTGTVPAVPATTVTPRAVPVAPNNWPPPELVALQTWQAAQRRMDDAWANPPAAPEAQYTPVTPQNVPVAPAWYPDQTALQAMQSRNAMMDSAYDFASGPPAASDAYRAGERTAIPMRPQPAWQQLSQMPLWRDQLDANTAWRQGYTNGYPPESANFESWARRPY